MNSSSSTHDVAVVGAGPVGLYLALRLARAGRKVLVVEAREHPYPLPRAVHFDSEIARAFAAAGLTEGLAEITSAAPTYEWRNAAGQTLLHFDWSGTGPSGWPIATMFSQPHLEAVLHEQVRLQDRVTVLRGHEAIAIEQSADGVELTLRSGGKDVRVDARYVVGCDGARSFVRQQMGVSLTDQEFAFDWLVVDTIPQDMAPWGSTNLQVCDPARPTTAVCGGPGRRRFEFMRLPGESIESLEDPAAVWRFLQPWGLTPDNAEVERGVVYTFAARWADSWRDGRVLIAGDAAHQMPPFAGQGMCSGIRDAANLAWKLDLVLRGVAGDVLLDTYTSERVEHLQCAIGQSVALGNVICMTDPDAVAQRDAVMIAGGGDPAAVMAPIAPPTLGDGVVHHLADGSRAPGTGVAAFQPRIVSHGGTVGLWDQVLGAGFDLVSPLDLSRVLGPERTAILDRIGIRVVRVFEQGAQVPPGCVGDIDGALIPHLAEAGHDLVAVRPDGYLFGAASAVDAVAFVDDLCDRLSVIREPVAGIGEKANLLSPRPQHTTLVH